MRAGPEFITKGAVIADWPANPKDSNAEYRILRTGKTEWTCLPGIRDILRTKNPGVFVTITSCYPIVLN